MDTGNFTPDERSIAIYLESLRSAEPTPGGGSAAAYTGALGAALLAMVCRLTLNSRPGEDTSLLGPTADRLDSLVDRLSSAARDDEACYGRYRTAAAMSKASEEEKQARRAAMQDALIAAGRAPLASAGLALQALELAPQVAATGTIHALSDVATAKHLLIASVAGSLVNVEVNIGMIKDPDACADLGRQVEEIRSRVPAMAGAVDEALDHRH